IQGIEVLTNAETPKEIEKALKAGASGVGLCRTEHMFLSAERMSAVQDVLFKAEPDASSFEILREFQEQDFFEIFKVLGEKEIVIRYLDAPLHEFGESHESNPMLGFRGARMLLAKPELIKIQSRAIFGALMRVEQKPQVVLELPLVVSAQEVKIFKEVVLQTLKEFPELSTPSFAVMVETPRAALLADELASEVDYLSFGTNDLTQMTYGFSRDDSSDFIQLYKKLGILEANPFEELDEIGVGELMRLTIEKARKANSKIKISVCGEQAGNKTSIKFLKKLGVDSISVGPGKVWQAIFSVAKN
ncbi:MAG: putative PEP-binding protein, partial [archaeon]